MKTWFITGTDTDAGKTVVTSALLQTMASQGILCAGYKPVASGSKNSAEGLRNHDALVLQHAANCDLPYSKINPYTFAEPTSPHIVSEVTGQAICFDRMSHGLHYLQQRVETVVVEGAGGWFTPLSKQQRFSDWVILERLPVILTVGMKLGCINHALLTCAAIEQAGLQLVGWVANHIQPVLSRKQEYLSYLTSAIAAPYLGEIPYFTGDVFKKDLSGYLQMPRG